MVRSLDYHDSVAAMQLEDMVDTEDRLRDIARRMSALSARNDIPPAQELADPRLTEDAHDEALAQMQTDLEQKLQNEISSMFEIIWKATAEQYTVDNNNTITALQKELIEFKNSDNHEAAARITFRLEADYSEAALQRKAEERRQKVHASYVESSKTTKDRLKAYASTKTRGGTAFQKPAAAVSKKDRKKSNKPLPAAARAATSSIAAGKQQIREQMQGSTTE